MLWYQPRRSPMPTHNSLERDRAAPLRRPAPADAPAADGAADAHPLLTLQRQVGNARVARMLAQREDAPATAPKEDDEELKKKVQAKHDPSLAQREEAPEATPK